LYLAFNPRHPKRSWPTAEEAARDADPRLEPGALADMRGVYLRNARALAAAGLLARQTPQINAAPTGRHSTTDPSIAIDIVAHRVLANDGAEPSWEDYPEIGENDWFAIQYRVTELAVQAAPNTRDYKAAYDLLAERAAARGGLT
jgi:hypothetical protein